MVISALRQKSKFEFRTFLKKKRILGFPWYSTREDLSIDVSINNIGLILTKLWWFQLYVESQNSNFELFWKKKNQILGFPCCSTREDLSIDFFSRGTDRWTDGRKDRRTDRQGFGILIWKHVGTQKISTRSSKLVVSCRSLYASQEDGDE